MLRSRVGAAVALVAGCLPLASADTPTYPPLPKAVSSFGAVARDGFVYVYGGHAGTPHSYSSDTSLGTFHRLPLAGGAAWESLPGGPGLIGLNLASAGGKVYRVGGTATPNKAGEPSKLLARQPAAGERSTQGRDRIVGQRGDDDAVAQVDDRDLARLPPVSDRRRHGHLP